MYMLYVYVYVCEIVPPQHGGLVRKLGKKMRRLFSELWRDVNM